MSKKQLHIDIPTPLYDQLRVICPEHGMISILVRRLLRTFVSAYVRKEVSPDLVCAQEAAEKWKESTDEHDS